MARVMVAGAGFAGMWAALGAARARRDLGAAAADVRIDVVAPTPLLCIKPRLYERHEPVLDVDIAPLLAAVDVGFIAATVDAIEPARRVARLRRGDTVIEESYDALVLATGSRTVPPPASWAPHMFVLDDTGDALRLRRHLAGLARQRPSAGRHAAVVIGAGFTGLEIATELAGWLRDLAAPSGETAGTILLDRATSAGATLGEAPQAAIAAALAHTGVDFRAATEVVNVDRADSGDAIVRLGDGGRIEAGTVVWAAGLRAHPLGGSVGAVDRDGRLAVDQTLCVVGQADIFAAGDAARASAAPGRATLMSCQHAMPTGRVAGHNAVRRLAGVAPIDYAQPMYVTCLDLGAAGAVFAHGWERAVLWTGADAKAVKRMINGRLIAPPPPGQPDLALRLADATPLPAVEATALAARWRAMLEGEAARKAV